MMYTIIIVEKILEEQPMAHVKLCCETNEDNISQSECRHHPHPPKKKQTKKKLVGNAKCNGKTAVKHKVEL